jgi:vancomycin resistance protein YoaR
MKKTLLFTTLATGLVLTGCNKATRTDTASTEPVRTDTTATAPATTTEPTVGQRVDAAAARTGDALSNAGRSLENAGRDASVAMRNAGSDISAKLTEWKLSAQELEADLRANRPIVRTNTNTTTTANVDKSQLKSNVKAAVSAQASAIKDLDVEIDRETEVVLTGTAMSADQVGTAMAHALNTPGVTKVTSKIKLDK